MEHQKPPGLMAQAWSRPLRDEFLGTAFGLVAIWMLSIVTGHFVLMVVVALSFQAAMLWGRFIHNNKTAGREARSDS